MKCPLLHGNIQKETDRETVPKFRTYRSVFLFHQNFTATVPKFRTFHSWLTACQPRPTVTTEGVLFFFTRILPRWDQNSGLLKKKNWNFFSHQECNSFSPESCIDRTKVQGFQFHIQECVSFSPGFYAALTIGPQLALCRSSLAERLTMMSCPLHVFLTSALKI